MAINLEEIMPIMKFPQPILSCDTAKSQMTVAVGYPATHYKQESLPLPSAYAVTMALMSRCVAFSDIQEVTQATDWWKAKERPTSGHNPMCCDMSLCMRGSWDIRFHGRLDVRETSLRQQSPAHVLVPTLGITVSEWRVA
jgi:hypothetical protein